MSSMVLVCVLAGLLQAHGDTTKRDATIDRMFQIARDVAKLACDTGRLPESMADVCGVDKVDALGVDGWGNAMSLGFGVVAWSEAVERKMRGWGEVPKQAVEVLLWCDEGGRAKERVLALEGRKWKRGSFIWQDDVMSREDPWYVPLFEGPRYGTTLGKMNWVAERAAAALAEGQSPVAVLERFRRGRPESTDDAWNNEIGVELGCALYSYGLHGLPGGSGYDADILGVFSCVDCEGEWCEPEHVEAIVDPRQVADLKGVVTIDGSPEEGRLELWRYLLAGPERSAEFLEGGGLFELGWVPEGDYVLLYRPSEDWAARTNSDFTYVREINVEAGVDQVIGLDIETAEWVEGWVIAEDGTPVQGARVELREAHPKAWWVGMKARREKKTDQDGRFGFGRVPFGQYRLNVWCGRANEKEVLSATRERIRVEGGVVSIGDVVVKRLP